ncbi:hypothetical protein Cni_G19870 [Canna indica]|uniref:Reverse transcriptase domain-containing protein n=1 Tax=Canna indica TaxID=4628 RepID=A0AAQ3KM29_9LILI|nr:hypothetical protein Cni_G19870 [Canna indica]
MEGEIGAPEGRSEARWPKESEEFTAASIGVRHGILAWLKNNSSNSFNRIKTLQQSLQTISPINEPDYSFTRRRLEAELADALHDEESTLLRDIETSLSGLQRKVSRRHNNWLLRPITSEEVRQAVFSINPESAPGLDGFTGAFFRHHWSLLSDELMTAVASFFRSKKLLHSFNDTIIALIPKRKIVSDMLHPRPINLCNVVYKICSKIIVHRLQPLMDKLISLNQSAFVQGRLILENILLAHEMVHHLKTRQHNSKVEMALKIDMSSAYDRVE